MALIATGSIGGVALPSFGNPASSGRASLDAPGILPPDLSTSEIARAVSEALGPEDRPLLIGVGLLWLVVLSALWLLSVRCEAALCWGTLEIARDGEAGRRSSWRKGRRFFGRFAGLSLISWLFGLLLAGALVAWSAAHRPEDTLLGWWEAYVRAAASPVLFFGTLLLGPIQIWLTYARRCIALQDVSFARGLAAGWHTLRRHVGASLLGWLINMAFYASALIVLCAALLVLMVVAAIVFAVVLRALPNGAASLAGGIGPYIALGVIVALVVVALGLAAISLFLWSFWSQLYLRLSAPVYDGGSVAVG